MQTRITPDEMRAAARQLAKSERGRTALKRLTELVASGEFDLDFLDQRACLALLGGLWSGQKDAVTEAIRAGSSEGAQPTP